MGLFSFFNTSSKNRLEVEETSTTKGPTEEQFIDNSEPTETQQEAIQAYNLERILNYVGLDFESRGYEDSLIHPDTSYKEDNISLLKIDLSILIKKSKIYYEEIIRIMDFHIQSRQDAGLILIVNELKTKKETLVEKLNEVVNIQDSQDEEQGMNHRIRLSYNRGFNRGLAALSTQLLQTNLG